MYEDYYRFRRQPFSPTPDPEFLYKSDSHQRALEQLLRGIRRREGMLLLTGDVGNGKTHDDSCPAPVARQERVHGARP